MNRIVDGARVRDPQRQITPPSSWLRLWSAAIRTSFSLPPRRKPPRPLTWSGCRPFIGWTLPAACLLGGLFVARSGEQAPLQNLIEVRALLSEAERARRSGEASKALLLTTRAIALNPRHAESWMYRGRLHEAYLMHRQAAGDFARVLELTPGTTEAHLRRGFARFRQGRIAKSIEDFDRVIELEPERRGELWQRGIALFLVGRYDEARRQFEFHQIASTQDVENAAWHFLCVGRLEGLAVARTKLFTVREDSRVPMAEVHALLAGRQSPEAVLKSVDQGEPDPPELARRRFAAELYVGLFHDAAGDRRKALDHVLRAAGNAPTKDYLYDVARLYAERLKGEVGP